MYGLPADFDPSVFDGKELIQVCFSVNTVDLQFDGDLSITLTTSFLLGLNERDTKTQHTVPAASSELMSLAGKSVQSANAQSNGTLTLNFEGGGVIVCLDDSAQYESYVIHVGDKEIYV